MTHQEIVAMCDQTLNRKASEYATAEDRWHNFHQSAKLFDDFVGWNDIMDRVSPTDCVTMFALKHYTSCVDIAIGKPASPEMVKEKAGDLLNYYCIYCCIRDGKSLVDVDDLLTDLISKPRAEGMPWVLGYQLLKELK